MLKAPFPWQLTLWQQLQQRHRQKRLPHALLLAGPAGMGKRLFAEALTQSLLCEAPDPSGSPCGQCRGCLLWGAGNHPDFRLVRPEEEGKAIGVEAVRQLGNFQAQKAQYGRYQIVLIEPAELMNLNAANALLKTLEEPTPDTLLLLVSSTPARLLPTLRSRCQALSFKAAADPQQTRAWLDAQLQDTGQDSSQLLTLAAGAPLRALELVASGVLDRRAEVFEQFEALSRGRADAVAIAQQWQGLELPWLLDLLQGWLADQIRLKSLPGIKSEQLSHPDLQQRLQPLVEQVDLLRLYRRLDKVQSVKGLGITQANKQLMLEDLLLAIAY